MKLSSILCASVVALAGLALTANGAFAAAKVVSHSNTNNNRLDPNDPNAEKACTDAGGKVSADEHGQKSCDKAFDANRGSFSGKRQHGHMAVKGSGVPQNDKVTVHHEGKTTDSTSPN
jgi:hypothetical protein